MKNIIVICLLFVVMFFSSCATEEVQPLKKIATEGLQDEEPEGSNYPKP